MTKLSGVYLIRQKSTGLYYLGSSCHIRKRWQQHRRELNDGIHHNYRLQAAWNKCGADDFWFMVVDKCAPQDLIYTEQFFLDTLKPWLPENGFNHAKNAEKTALGIKRTDVTKRRMSEALSGTRHPCYGKPINPETHAKMMLSIRGKKRPECGRRKKFELESPEGMIVSFDGVRRFCRKFNLSVGNVSSVLSGRLKQTKGWKRVAGVNSNITPS